MFAVPVDHSVSRSRAGAASPVRPFGLTLALPVIRPSLPEPTGPLSFCPERQITVTPDGEPFIHAPSMKSEFLTVAQTTEDMQLDEESENDTD
ncbi:putative ATP-grasp-modified RiPP [Streptomyces sp. NPDC000594]|uniref:putative ATP-grasp-modified RiPP n=1 Tax=Streptomyces sp. NPDC000594 TaxID=3154261 RepID=UPI0033334B34